MIYFTGCPLSSERESLGPHVANQGGAVAESQYFAALQQAFGAKVEKIVHKFASMIKI
jgi:hypothetical protein